MGDFNYICSSKKRVGLGTSSSASGILVCLDFLKFISMVELIDLPLFGRKFTWFQPKGGAASQINCILMSSRFTIVLLFLSILIRCGAPNLLDLIINGYLIAVSTSWWFPSRMPLRFMVGKLMF